VQGVARRRHNTQTARDRRELVRDFERRLRYNQQQGDCRHWLQRPRSLAWVVHPTADETQLLAELGMRPDDCRSADAYWRYRDRVHFVLLHGSLRHNRPPGVYYRFDRDSRQDDFDVFLPRPVVTSEDFHRVFDLLEALIDEGIVDAARAALEDGDSRWLVRQEPLAEME
jgi:hypothetical protein